jgi:hypothetical protein
MKRSTGIVLVIFLALVGLLFYLNQKESPAEEQDATPVPPTEFLFDASLGAPVSIDIKSEAGEQVAIVRNEDGVWVLKQPIETEANQGSAEAAASQLSSLRIESRLKVASDAAGLVQPSFILTVEMGDGTVNTVRIGDLTPTGIGYYVQVNDSDETIIVDKTGLDALLVLVESPPYIDETGTSTP